MALVGSGNALAAARKAAKNAVVANWRAVAQSQGRALSPAEVEEMKTEMEQADSAAIVAHIATFAQVLGAAGGVTVGPATAPVTGKII